MGETTAHHTRSAASPIVPRRPQMPLWAFVAIATFCRAPAQNTPAPTEDPCRVYVTFPSECSLHDDPPRFVAEDDCPACQQQEGAPIQTVCDFEKDSRFTHMNMFVEETNSTGLVDGEPVDGTLNANFTHTYTYSNYNVTTFNQPDELRNLVIHLEPCHGTVFLFVRKTRRCFPNPYSCIDVATDTRTPGECEWVHFMTQIDGSRDGTATFLEIPLSTTKYFISVFAMEDAAYELTVLADTGAIPRPGGNGRVIANQTDELSVTLSWDPAHYIPTGVSDTKHYIVYASLLKEGDDRTNRAVFFRKDKIMNTVCGLVRNTDHEYSIVPASDCKDGTCTAVVNARSKQRYIFNVVAESHRGLKFAYAGGILKTDWEVVRQVTDADNSTLAAIGAVAGSVLGIVVMTYIMLLNIYG